MVIQLSDVVHLNNSLWDYNAVIPDRQLQNSINEKQWPTNKLGRKRLETGRTGRAMSACHRVENSDLDRRIYLITLYDIVY